MNTNNLIDLLKQNKLEFHQTLTSFTLLAKIVQWQDHLLFHITLYLKLNLRFLNYGNLTFFSLEFVL